MNKLKCTVALLAVVLGIIGKAYAVPKVIPVINGQFTTGQWYSDGDKSALGGNISLNVIPAVRYSNRLSVIPSVSTTYRGTRAAEELAGGATLFQDTWESSLGVKVVHGLSQRLKIRENVGARMKWNRETTDENWSKGLYDYRVFNVGVEGEYSWSKLMSVSLGYDFSSLIFPNYESLESEQSSDLSREYAADNPLDQMIHLVSVRFGAPFVWNMKAGLQGFYSPRHYRSQTIVGLSGELSSDKREDDYVGTTLTLERSFNARGIRISPTIFYGYSTLNSNQNHYDARQTTFMSDFYDYDQQRTGAQITVAFGQKSIGPNLIDIGMAYSDRQYSSRVIQSDSGAYLSEKLYNRETHLTLGFSYPLSRNFRMRLSSAFIDADSNNQYEEVYRYNYSNSNYQFGVSYEY